jgi:hypothetical protein
MGQIEVRTRAVNGTWGVYDHAYIVHSYTDKHGIKHERAIAGYPSSGIFSAPNYKVVEGKFNSTIL